MTNRHQPTARDTRDKIPLSTHELVDWLERVCPEPRPHPTQTQEQIMFEAGRRSLVLMIRGEFEKRKKGE